MIWPFAPLKNADWQRIAAAEARFAEILARPENRRRMADLLGRWSKASEAAQTDEHIRHFLYHAESTNADFAFIKNMLREAVGCAEDINMLVQACGAAPNNPARFNKTLTINGSPKYLSMQLLLYPGFNINPQSGGVSLRNLTCTASNMAHELTHGDQAQSGRYDSLLRNMICSPAQRLLRVRRMLYRIMKAVKIPGEKASAVLSPLRYPYYSLSHEREARAMAHALIESARSPWRKALRELGYNAKFQPQRHQYKAQPSLQDVSAGVRFSELSGKRFFAASNRTQLTLAHRRMAQVLQER